ncbi:hypothetical protein [Methanosarcina sp. WH1]|uniref:hypothetical protein n=1 Tax=Methanosarcina sp. WH1 TaxID=1434102 RepID=UPI00064E23A8|nr:hypothetical protein [Methanosarcina sp. WH1]
MISVPLTIAPTAVAASRNASASLMKILCSSEKSSTSSHPALFNILCSVVYYVIYMLLRNVIYMLLRNVIYMLLRNVIYMLLRNMICTGGSLAIFIH